MTMDIDLIPMPYGDCILLSWTDADGTPRLVALDSGTASAYRSSIRQKLREASRDIDLWVISHPHSDHIGGALKFSSDINMPRCRQWCINTCQPHETDCGPQLDDGSIAASAGQARNLNNAIRETGASVTRALAGDRFDIGDLHISVLAPLQRDVERANATITAPTGDGSVAAASESDDYDQPVDSFDLDNFVEDDQLYNRASIALLLEYHGRKFLWMADAVPSVVCDTLRKLGYDEQHPLTPDYASLAHHGSRGNTTREWATLVAAPRYILTANARNVHNLPHKSAMSCILRTARDPRSPITFIFPTDSDAPRQIFLADGHSVFSRYAFTIQTALTHLNL